MSICQLVAPTFELECSSLSIQMFHIHLGMGDTRVDWDVYLYIHVCKLRADHVTEQLNISTSGINKNTWTFLKIETIMYKILRDAWNMKRPHVSTPPVRLGNIEPWNP